MYQKKTWKARTSEFPTRRALTDVSTGAVQTVNVARDEGTVSEQGDGFSAANMNDLEARIAAGLDEKQDTITVKGIVKGDGSGGVSAAVGGTDFVAPVAGKGLSTNDYTTVEKNKLAGLSAPVSRTASLTVAGWSNKAQSVSVAGVTANSILTVTYAPASHDAWLDAGVYCSAQGAGTLTFTCESVPTAALTANIVILA